jgi:hypothetical protein
MYPYLTTKEGPLALSCDFLLEKGTCFLEIHIFNERFLLGAYKIWNIDISRLDPRMRSSHFIRHI